jgi:hypothetical protein
MALIKNDTIPTGNLEGGDHGATVSLILDESEPGKGPRLHRHPYDSASTPTRRSSPSGSSDAVGARSSPSFLKGERPGARRVLAIASVRLFRSGRE